MPAAARRPADGQNDLCVLVLQPEDQPLDNVDWPALNQRLRQNSVQEKLTAEWIDHCLVKLGKREMQRL